MGRGKKIYRHHALPWQRAITFITDTKKEDWKVHMKKVFPKLLKKT
jgi:hypothetical protein